METSPFHLRGYMMCILEDSNPAVGLSLARFPPQRRSSVAAAAAAAAAATESSIPSGATWNSRASRGALSHLRV